MREVVDLNFSPDGELEFVTVWDESTQADCVLEIENVELMQFTGLNDKNGQGKEVYEGDIIKSRTSGVEREVYWNQKECQWDTRSINLEGEYRLPLGQIDFYYEVIGNIYEDAT